MAMVVVVLLVESTLIVPLACALSLLSCSSLPLVRARARWAYTRQINFFA